MYYDRNISPQNFNVDKVVCLPSGPKPKKLENQYSDPYKILEALGNGKSVNESILFLKVRQVWKCCSR